jgi:hypothetical protein
MRCSRSSGWLTPCCARTRRGCWRRSSCSPPPPHCSRNCDARLACPGLADQVAAGWSDPASVRQVVLARLQNAPFVRDPAMAPLERLRGLRPEGWGGLRLDIGPAQGSGGFGLTLAWSDGAWRATGIALLDRPSAFRGGV